MANMRQLTNATDDSLWNGYESPIKLIALVGSAGGLDAFGTILSRLPHHFPCPILIAQHRFYRADGRDFLVEILARQCSLKVVQAKNGAKLRAGSVYVGPPNQHLSVTDDLCVQLGGLQLQRRDVPSADRLFTSMAEQVGGAIIVGVLSGSLRDGSIGVVKIKACGGRVIVQDPETARFPSMPSATISTGCADFILAADRVADALITLTMVPGGSELFQVPSPAWVQR